MAKTYGEEYAYGNETSLNVVVWWHGTSPIITKVMMANEGKGVDNDNGLLSQKLDNS